MSLAGELIAVSTLSLPQKRFSMILRITSLFRKVSVYCLSSLVNGAMKTGDSKQTAISLRNLLLAKKLRLGRSKAKLINLSFSFFSINAMVRLM